MFEWDEAKRRRNLADKKVDFVDALDVFDNPDRLEFQDTRFAYGEERYNVLCPLRGRLFHVTYTMRGGARRIISARKANRREVRKYERERAGHEGDPSR